MKSYTHSCLLVLALIVPCSHAAAPDPALVGCWQAVKIVLSNHDGSTIEDKSGRCTLRFREDQLESSCATSSATATTTYRYAIPRPGFYLATMTGSTFTTDLIGSAREYEYRIEGDRLVTVTYPQAKLPAAATAAKRVDSEAARTSCPNPLGRCDSGQAG
jgi:hypothetical protein